MHDQLVSKPRRPMLQPTGAVVQLATVSVSNVRISADIGILPHEIGRMQPLILDVTLHLTTRAPRDLADTVDYTTIVAAASELGEERIGLIETFVHRLAGVLLNDPRVQLADVRVEKPNALDNGIAAARVVLGRPAGSVTLIGHDAERRLM